jgi:polysaccharide biosynthesis transport protein
VELREYLNIIRGRWWLIALSAVVCVAIALVTSLLQKPTYQGQAQVLVLARQNTGSLLVGASQDQQPAAPEQADVVTQAQVIQSPRIASEVVKSLGLTTSAANLLRRVTATTDGQSNIVTIDALDGSAERAARIANEFAQAYVSWSRDTEMASLKAAGDEVAKSLAAAQQRVTELAGSNGSSSQNELRMAESLSSALTDKLAQIRINQGLATGSASVLALAVTDPNPVSPNPVRNSGLGLVLGLALGLGIVFVAEQMNTRIRTQEEAQEIYGAPVLASIPTEVFGKGETRRLTMTQHPDTPAADAYRGLRINMDFINFEKQIKTVVVASAVPGEGKSTVAANLACALAESGQKVVLLGCDFRRPTETAFFECADGLIGLSDLLKTGKPRLEAFQKVPGLDTLVVVAAGSMPPNPSDLLGSSRMKELVASLRESMDWVIMDAPPLLAVPDAAALARWADGVLMVAHVGASTRDAALTARGQLEKVGARILGISVWGARVSAATARAYSGYYHSD